MIICLHVSISQEHKERKDALLLRLHLLAQTSTRIGCTVHSNDQQHLKRTHHRRTDSTRSIRLNYDENETTDPCPYRGLVLRKRTWVRTNGQARVLRTRQVPELQTGRQVLLPRRQLHWRRRHRWDRKKWLQQLRACWVLWLRQTLRRLHAGW